MFLTSKLENGITRASGYTICLEERFTAVRLSGHRSLTQAHAGRGGFMRIATKYHSHRLWTSELLEDAEQEARLSRSGLDVFRLGRGEPIVMVPGLAGGCKLLWPLAKRLARHHEVILAGLRGDRFPIGSAGAVDIADHASDLADLIEELRLECPTVMGVSFGGAIALEFALNYPQRVGTLIIYGTEARFRTHWGAQVARRVLERFPLPSDNGFVNQFFNLLHGKRPESGPLADEIVACCWETDQSIIAQRLGLLETFDVSDRLWQLVAPTLVMAGTRDVIVPPTRQRQLASAIAEARFVTVEGAGHIGFLTHSEQVAGQVRNHLAQVRHSQSQL
jgi:pimeloyl-ACP methyl ester carboxylesterase